MTSNDQLSDDRYAAPADGRPPRYADTTDRPVDYLPAVNDGGDLTGYLWYSEADHAAGFQPRTASTADHAPLHWAARLADARERGLTPAQAVERFLTEPGDPLDGTLRADARATADSLRRLLLLAAEGSDESPPPVEPRGYRPFPEMTQQQWEQARTAPGWLFHADPGHHLDGPVPPHAVQGAWQLDRDGTPLRFWPNPRHGVPATPEPDGEAAPVPPLRAGRRPAGLALFGWLEDARSPRLCRVAGSSGSGRTHLLNWLAAACPPDNPRPARRVHAALSARELTVDSAVWLLADRLGVTAGTPEALVRALIDGVPRVLVVTDLDRAGHGLLPGMPEQIAARLLLPLLRIPWLRLVVECANGTPAAELLDSALPAAAVLDLDEPRWTDPHSFALWCSALTGHQVDQAAVHPSPALALLAARTPSAPVLDPATPLADRAAVLADAWWDALPMDVRPALAALASVGGHVDDSLWAELPGVGMLDAVDRAATHLLPPDRDGAWRLWPDLLTERHGGYGVDALTLRQVLVPPDPATADPRFLGLALRQSALADDAAELLADPNVLTHADPLAVTAAFEHASVAAAERDRDGAAGQGEVSGPHSAVDGAAVAAPVTPDQDAAVGAEAGPSTESAYAALAEAWWLAGPLAVPSADPAIRAEALCTWLAGRDDRATARLPQPTGRNWRLRWSFDHDREPVHRIAEAHGPLPGRLAVAVGSSILTVDQESGALADGTAPAPLEDRALVALATGADGTILRLRRDGSVQASADRLPGAVTALLDHLQDGATALASLGGEQAVLAVGDAGGRVHHLADADGGAPRSADQPLHDGPVTALALARTDGEILTLSGGRDGAVWTWMHGRKPMPDPLAARDVPVTATAVATTPRGMMIAAAWSDGLTRVWRWGDTATTADLDFGAPPTGLVITPTGRLCLALPAGVLAVDLD
ncbi:hypothetical protein AB0K51_00955 [Kitasatospora sp. NPDC049285]|uniref:hypothetical protein n=1 Tax=Kitasatospora sp. NPDC049285 TaxID=3157096 RepID=UPI003422C210